VLGRFIAPLHPDGLKFVLSGAVLTLVFFLLWAPLGWVSLILTLLLAYFFRDPWRVTPTREGLIVSPADGIVLSIAPAQPPAELLIAASAATRISIFLSLFDVHVSRAPVAGRVLELQYVKGRFLSASLDKASLHNERLGIRIEPREGPEIGFVLIAGLLARRIVCDLYKGQEVAAGQRIGIIRFGSRVDIYLPSPYAPMVIAGQRMVGGETVLADRRASEGAPEGRAQ
jgi:phosphatidylserine decarboxylase